MKSFKDAGKKNFEKTIESRENAMEKYVKKRDNFNSNVSPRK